MRPSDLSDWPEPETLSGDGKGRLLGEVVQVAVRLAPLGLPCGVVNVWSAIDPKSVTTGVSYTIGRPPLLR